MDNESGKGVDGYTLKVAAILRRAYKEKGLSYTTLAEETGLGRATVERIINGKRPISTYYLHVLCPLLGTTPAAVMDEASRS